MPIAPLPSLWDCLIANDVPKEHRPAACAAFGVWLAAHTAQLRGDTDAEIIRLADRVHGGSA